MDEFTKAIQEQDVHTLSDLIETGQYTDQYHLIKNYPDIKIRVQLASQGYYLDTYIKDKKAPVRNAVIAQDPSYLPELFNTKDPQNNKIVVAHFRENDVSIDMLQEYLDSPLAKANQNSSQTKLVRLKVDGETTGDLLTQTMTTQQLFMANNPGWASSFSLRALYYIQLGVELLEENKLPRELALVGLEPGLYDYMRYHKILSHARKVLQGCLKVTNL